MTEPEKKKCVNQACSTRNIVVTTDKEKCIACGQDLEGEFDLLRKLLGSDTLDPFGFGKRRHF